MFPYLAMFAVPGSIALSGARRSVFLLAVVGALYWAMIGLRFQVGMDFTWRMRPFSAVWWDDGFPARV